MGSKARRVWREERRCPSEEVAAGFRVSEHEGLVAGRLEPRSCLGGELSLALADQAKLGAAAVRLLEMETDDLVLALRFRSKPPGQALVQVGAHFWARPRTPPPGSARA